MPQMIWDIGLDVLLAVLSAVAVGFAKWYGSKMKKERDEAIKNAETIAEQKLDNKIEIKLEPIYEELNELRQYIRQAEETETAHTALILASYRFRLIQLCKAYLAQGYITSKQMEQLSEFFKIYTGLGGNGQAAMFYEKTMALPVKVDKNEDVGAM